MALDKELAAAAALADTSKLEPFEGRTVARSTVAIKRAGDGLSNALAVEPKAYHQGETVFVLMECKVGPVSFPPLHEDTPDVLARKHDFKAQAATVIAADIARPLIDAQKAAIQKAKDAAIGQGAIETGDGIKTPNLGKPKAAKGAAKKVSKGEAMEFANDRAAGKAKPVDEVERKRQAKNKAEAAEAVTVLSGLSKPQLRQLCDRHSIPNNTKTTGKAMVEQLADVAGVLDEAKALAES